MERPSAEDLAGVMLWAPVVGVAAASQLRLGLEQPWTGTATSLAVTSLALAAPLALRRDHPLVAAALVAAALPLQVLLGGSLHFGSFLAALVAGYALGRYAPGRVAVAGVVVLAGITLALRDELPEEAAFFVFPLFYVGGTAALGAVVRRLTCQASELRRLNAELARERDTAARLAVASERVRLARDLHDVVAHTLTVTVVQAESCEQAITDDPAHARTAAREVQAAGRRGLAELRSMVRVLRDAEVVESEPRLDDVETLAAVISDAGVEVEVRRSGQLRDVPDHVAHQLFRLVQEALTNVVRHSGARSALVTVTSSPEGVEVCVQDPGPAVAGELSSGGHGLAGMAERLSSYGGFVDAGPHGGGFLVRARVPLARLRPEGAPGAEPPAREAAG